MAKDKKRKKNEEPDFPQTIHITFDPNVTEFLAHTDIERAVEDDGPTRVAEYRYVREATYRKTTVEE